jgi:tetratricopeptide (TPR) repeat protein
MDAIRTNQPEKRRKMELTHSIDATRLRETKSKAAVQHALEGRWEEAAAINEEILYYFPNNTEALNRLGKASMEAGYYDRARNSFEKVLTLAPHNNIAKKNLTRLERLSQGAASSHTARRVVPRLFLEESGKSGITDLRIAASEEAVAKVAGGDGVMLEVHNHTLVVKSLDEDVLGYVEPRLGSRLARLINQGNRYEGAILSAGAERITVIIRETYRNAALGGVPSFPATGIDAYRGQIRDSLLALDFDGEIEGVHRDDPTAMWTEDGEEVPVPSGRELVRAMVSRDDGGDE